MLDEFVRGDVRRISPEAPVPVLTVTTRELRLGGAANTAANVRSLGARATLSGIVGEDVGAAQLHRLLAEGGIDAEAVTDPSRPTTHKTRIVARGQQVVRIDHEHAGAPSAEVAARLHDTLAKAVGEADAVIVSDYAKGVVSREACAVVVEAAKRRGCPVVIDPKRNDLGIYGGATVITPNLLELEAAAGRALHATDEIIAAMRELLPTLRGSAILTTRGGDGMTLLEPEHAPVHFRATARSVFDVTGAGDTVVATLALALASGVPMADAIVVASAAAGVAVSKAGTATVSVEELSAALDEIHA